MKNYARLAPALLCLALGACSDTALSLVCPGVVGPSLLVNVVDSASGESVTAEARGWWTTGTVTDSLRHLPPSNVDGAVLLAAYGPPGSYDIRVERPGRPDWVRNGVIVVQGTCGPDGEDLVAQFTAVQ